MAATLVGLIGSIGSGKDTVANMFVEEFGFTRDSFATPLKDTVSSIFGWRRELLEGDTIESRDFRETPDMFWSRKLDIPNFTPRLALQLIGTDTLRNFFHEDIWLSSFEYRYRSNNDSNDNVILSDVRFRNELELIKQLGGVTIWVQRSETPEWWDTAVKANEGNVIAKKVMNTKYRDVHSSEWNWAGYRTDFTIQNNGTLEDLHNKIKEIKCNVMKPKLTAI